MSQIKIEKQVYDKNSYGKVIDTEFRQFGKQIETPIPFTLEDFFKLYNGLFYQIPKEGDIESHMFILKKEADYLGISIENIDVQDLLDEITLLRQEVLESQINVTELSDIIKKQNINVQ